MSHSVWSYTSKRQGILISWQELSYNLFSTTNVAFDPRACYSVSLGGGLWETENEGLTQSNSTNSINFLKCLPGRPVSASLRHQTAQHQNRATGLWTLEKNCINNGTRFYVSLELLKIYFS